MMATLSLSMVSFMTQGPGVSRSLPAIFKDQSEQCILFSSQNISSKCLGHDPDVHVQLLGGNFNLQIIFFQVILAFLSQIFFPEDFQMVFKMPLTQINSMNRFTQALHLITKKT